MFDYSKFPEGSRLRVFFADGDVCHFEEEEAPIVVLVMDWHKNGRKFYFEGVKMDVAMYDYEPDDASCVVPSVFFDCEDNWLCQAEDLQHTVGGEHFDCYKEGNFYLLIGDEKLKKEVIDLRKRGVKIFLEGSVSAWC